MTLVINLLQEKGQAVHTVDPGASVYDAIRKMADEDIGSLVVVENGQMAGIITERHYARSVILRGKASANTPVRDIMARRVHCVGPEDSLETCMAIMTESRVRHLLVMQGEDLVGLISIGDVVKAIISEQKFIIEELVHFVGGGR
ncbi:CBS domain-containing protein [Microbaculum marinum]|uniref:CBS domain-containing protein n=1 Tax=Microbaculum marinum TaxID=1764581 RepID=A0AAW9RRY4_9HYPH